MKVTVKREHLLAALERVKPAVPTKAHLPVLANFLLEAKDGRLTVAGTDLEVALASQCPARVIKGGKVVLSPKVVPLLKNLATPTITLYDHVFLEKYEKTEWRRNEQTGQTDPIKVPAVRRTVTIKIEAGQATASFGGIDPKDFPPLPQVPRSMPIRFSDLAGPLKKILYAAAREETRPVLSGVCFSPGKRMELTAADGFRLAITSVPFKGKLGKTVVVPHHACELLERMPGRMDVAVVEDKSNNAKIFFSQKGLTLSTCLIAGDYPKCEHLVPKGGHWLKCSADALRNALKQISVLKAHQGKVILRTKGKTLLVSATEDDKTIEVKVPDVKGRTDIAFDIHYLKDLVDQMDGGFGIQVTTPDAPVLARIDGATHVLMPMFNQK